MKAMVLHRYGGPENLVFEDRVPEPLLTPDTVLIEAAAASVNPIDWKIRSGARQKDFPLKLPAILGKDVSGVVHSIGSNVGTFKIGDRVLATSEATYAQFVSVEASLLTHLPHGMDIVDAAAIPLVVLTGEQLVRIAARVRAGQTVLVTGALGSVGRAAVHAAKKLGARVIAGVRRRQLSDALQLGASEVVAIDDDAALAELEMVDAVADTVGGDTAAKCFGRIKEGGSFGYASVFPESVSATRPSITVVRIFARPDASKVREFADDIRDGKFVLPITQRLVLAEAAQAHALAEKGGAGGKVILRIAAGNL